MSYLLFIINSLIKLSIPTHLTVGQLVPGLFAVGEDLPEDHAEAPDVALRGELPVHDALRGHPADWQHRASTHLRRKTRQCMYEREIKAFYHYCKMEVSR